MSRRNRRGLRGAKPLNALAALGTAAHHAFERRAGVGVFLEPWLGRRRTNFFWGVAIPVWVATALGGRSRDEPLLAFNAGTAVAGAVVHFAGWPWSFRLGIFPWLDEAEGLPPEKLTAYNAVLWSWLVGGAGSLVSEVRREHLKFAIAGLATAPLLLASAKHHFRWAREQAERDPAGWSPWLLADGGPQIDNRPPAAVER